MQIYSISLAKGKDYYHICNDKRYLLMKWLRNILKGVSLTAALFVFQACYGAPQIPEEEAGQAMVETKAEEVPAEEDAAAETPVVAQAE